jgi:2-oxoisovalerate dehydrogenase E2 component (dihydrolipoyl transacylase)
MGRYVFRLPDIGEGIARAEIVSWHVKVGETVDEDAPIADMMTDKATVEMESPVSGTVIEVAGEEGDTVSIGAPLVVIEVDGPGNEREEPSAAPEPEAPQPEPEKVAPVRASPAAPPKRVTVVERGPRAAVGDRALASPAVRARAAALGVDLGAVPTGADERVDHADLDAFLTEWGGAPKPAPAPSGDEPKAVAEAPGPEPKPAVPPVEVLEGAGEQVKVIGLRRRIAENMAASKRNIPHFSYVEECDVTALEDMRAGLNERRGERPKLTMLPLFITAVCRSLPDFPMINARYDDAAGVVQRYDSVHLGMATQTDSGLMVPVIREAQDKSVWELAAEIVRLAQAARDGSAKSDELSGSTLTVTSLGPLGGVATTPVINRPEVAIIGPNRIIERPVFVPDGQGGERIEKRKLMNISISCDHRVVDGWDAANFVQSLKRWIEAPMMLLAE